MTCCSHAKQSQKKELGQAVKTAALVTSSMWPNTPPTCRRGHLDDSPLPPPQGEDFSHRIQDKSIVHTTEPLDITTAHAVLYWQSRTADHLYHILASLRQPTAKLAGRHKTSSGGISDAWDALLPIPSFAAWVAHFPCCAFLPSARLSCRLDAAVELYCGTKREPPTTITTTPLLS